MNDMPTAVISGASRGAFRSGLYATRSIVALMNANSGIVTASVTSEPDDDQRSTPVSASSPKTEMIIVLATSPESANTSPWAKLISWRMP